MPNAAFKCLRCGACCRELAPVIVLSDVELWVRKGAWHIIGAVEEVEAGEGLRRLGLDRCFTFRRRGGSCYFYREGLCSIYELRPAVCRLFPFAYSGKGLGLHPWAREQCPGVKLSPFPSREEELTALAETITRELMGLPFYTGLIVELLERFSTGRKAISKRRRVDAIVGADLEHYGVQ